MLSKRKLVKSNNLLYIFKNNPNMNILIRHENFLQILMKAGPFKRIQSCSADNRVDQLGRWYVYFKAWNYHTNYLYYSFIFKAILSDLRDISCRKKLECKDIIHSLQRKTKFLPWKDKWEIKSFIERYCYLAVRYF